MLEKEKLIRTQIHVARVKLKYKGVNLNYRMHKYKAFYYTLVTFISVWVSRWGKK